MPGTAALQSLGSGQSRVSQGRVANEQSCCRYCSPHMTACEVGTRCQPECGNSGFVYLACLCSLHSREEWDERRLWQGFITGVGSVEVLAVIKYLVKTGLGALEMM